MKISIEEIKEEIKKFISNNFPIPEEKMLNNPRLVNDLGFNDMDCSVICNYFEEKYDIVLNNGKSSGYNIYTLESLAKNIVEEVEAYHNS
ncbi:MAG: hypothetical protein WC697_02425 [Patescibacteria group bacterium]|jgi:acyl carrier protein